MTAPTRWICCRCSRTYRLREASAVKDCFCCHCASSLKPVRDYSCPACHNAFYLWEAQPCPRCGKLSENLGAALSPHHQILKQQEASEYDAAGFQTIVQMISPKIPVQEIGLIQGMHDQGAIDTNWLKRNYVAEISGKPLSKEFWEEFPLIIFEHYDVVGEIGEGTMGIVYQGRNRLTGQKVAIKRLHPERIHDASVCERFLREAEFLKKLQHPYILPVLEGGSQQGALFLVSPFMDGGTLQSKIQELPPVRRMADISPLLAMMIKIGEALHYAHTRNLVHRDIKPSNILLQDDHPYLADFGLAKQLDSQRPSLTQGAVGTPCYMAPEAWQKQFSPQSDIYSLGVMLYEIMAGIYPFWGNHPEEILVKQLSGKPKPPISSPSLLPTGFNGPILKALSQQPAQRHSSVQELMGELKNAIHFEV